MRSSRWLVLTAALVFGSAISVVPLEVASAQAPSTQVLVPSSGATVSGTRVVLDARASSGVTQVKFELNGGLIAIATPTYYGWISLWNSTTFTDGTYTLTSIATEGGSSTTSAGISITVNNGSPKVSIVVPSPGGTVSGNPAVLDAVASPGTTQVTFDLVAVGCPNVSTTFPPIYICTIDAVPTIYGWIGTFDAAEFANGSYGLGVVAQYVTGQGANTPTMSSVTVDNHAQPAMVVPANNSTISGTQVLDCLVPSDAGVGAGALVYFVRSGDTAELGQATLTDYGWIYEWNTTDVTNGQYSLSCNAAYPYGGSVNSPVISITVSN